MYLKTILLSGAALCLPGALHAQSTQQCPTGATNCTISVQDAGHNSTAASADNSQTTSSIAGTSSASNQSGNTVSPVFDNNPQTTQNANTTTGSINSSSTSTGNMSSNANQSSASNGQSNTGTSSASNGQSNTGTSTNTLGGSSSGGNTLATGASTSAVGATTSSSGGNSLGSTASNSGGNSTTNVDASDHSVYRTKTIFIPPVVPGTPPSQLAVGNIIKETSACGPLQHIVRQQVNGTFIGLLRNAAVPQGWSDDLEPYRDASGVRVDYRTEQMPDGDVRMFGQQVVMFTTVIGVASNRNLALGGGSGGGSWGQAGMGSSSSNQRMVTTIQLRDCEIGTMHRVMVEVAPKAIRH